MQIQGAGLAGRPGGGQGAYRSGRYSGCTGRGLGTEAADPGRTGPEPAGLLWGGKAEGMSSREGQQRPQSTSGGG